MLKKSFVLPVIVIFSLIFLNNSDSFSQTLPKVSCSLSKKTFVPGEKGIITIKIKPKEGVKIPKEPQIEVTLTGDGVEGINLDDYSGAPGGDYFSNPTVKYNFKVSGNATQGSAITFKVKVKFGYCSSDSGICKIGNSTSTLKIKIK